jgi:hypothetical protein
MRRSRVQPLLASLLAIALFAALLAIALFAGCKSSGARPSVDGSPQLDATSPNLDTSADTGAALAPCLDTPSDLPRPPAGRLPCELVPPDLRL